MIKVARKPNTTTAGTDFHDTTVQAVWNKGKIVSGYDPNVHRKDICGAWMQRSAYGQSTEYGWEIDHARPVAHGGSDDLSNLQPLHWKNNRHKGDNWPNWSCLVGNN